MLMTLVRNQCNYASEVDSYTVLRDIGFITNCINSQVLLQALNQSSADGMVESSNI